MVKNHRTVKKVAEQAEHDPRQYRVGSYNRKTGRIRWAYSELLTLDEAGEIASSSRLNILAGRAAAPRVLPLSPRAAQRLAKYRAEGHGIPVECLIYVVLTDTRNVLKATESKDEAETCQKCFNDFHAATGRKASIRSARVEFCGRHSEC